MQTPCVIFSSSMKDILKADVFAKDDCHFLSVNIPSLGINNAILWIGSDCCSFGHGFALLPSVELFRSWMLVNVRMTHDWEESDNRSFLQAGFGSRSHACESKLREVKNNSFVIEGDMIPTLNASDNSGVRRPSLPSDYLLARVLAKGACALKSAIHAKGEEQVSVSLMHDGTSHNAQFVYPAPEVSPDDYRYTHLEY